MLYVVLLSWFSALIKNQGTFSDYHWEWSGGRGFTGTCCFGGSGRSDHIPSITSLGLFHQICQNVGINYNDERLCSRLSKVP